MIGVSVNTKGAEAKLKKLEEFVKFLKTSQGRDILKQLAELAVDLIYKRTKSGQGVNDDRSPNAVNQKLKALSSKYVNRRKKIKLGEFASPNRSNLTLTGKMLNSIEYKLTPNGFKLGIKNSARSDSDSTNKEIAGYVSEKGRPFFALTVKEQAQIKRLFINLVRQLATRIFSS